MKILVVEDRVEMRHLMRRMLKSIFPDAEVRLSFDGLDGLEAFEWLKPDLVVSDFSMPNMNGGEMAERIRAKYPEQKIILWTGGMYDVSDQYWKHFNKMLHKDCGIEVLRAALGEVLGKNLENPERGW